MVWRRIFGPKREEVAEGWRRLDNEEVHKFYPSPNIIRVAKLSIKYMPFQILINKLYLYRFQ
jgi:hypothetical protein